MGNLAGNRSHVQGELFKILSLNKLKKVEIRQMTHCQQIITNGVILLSRGDCPCLGGVSPPAIGETSKNPIEAIGIKFINLKVLKDFNFGKATPVR
jgi:hypothetical protein